MTPTAPPEPHHNGSFVLPSVALKTLATALLLLSMLLASGTYEFPVVYKVLCVRFAFSSLVHVSYSRNRLLRSARCATLDMGGWLSLTILILEFLPSRTFT
jgi:hypothetical protein